MNFVIHYMANQYSELAARPPRQKLLLREEIWGDYEIKNISCNSIYIILDIRRCRSIFASILGTPGSPGIGMAASGAPLSPIFAAGSSIVGGGAPGAGLSLCRFGFSVRIIMRPMIQRIRRRIAFRLVVF